jgi:hypothetical protein
MSLATYKLIVSTDHLSFEVYSEGPKGPIKKIVHYTKLKVVWKPLISIFTIWALAI